MTIAVDLGRKATNKQTSKQTEKTLIETVLKSTHNIYIGWEILFSSLISLFISLNIWFECSKALRQFFCVLTTYVLVDKYLN